MAGEIVACTVCGKRNRVPDAASGRPRCANCHADLPWLVEAGDGDFAAAIDTPVLVLVDLWAAWCGPCRTIAPILEMLAHERAGALKVVKVDVDRSPAVARRFDARSIPLLVFLRGGQVVDTLVGAHPAATIRSYVDRLT